MSNRMKVYSKTNCPKCVELKSDLKAYGVDYVEINVDNSPEDKEFLISRGHRSVPQVYFEPDLSYVGTKIADVTRFLII